MGLEPLLGREIGRSSEWIDSIQMGSRKELGGLEGFGAWLLAGS